MARLRASLFRRGRDFLGIEQIVGTVASDRLLRLAAKKLVLQGAGLSPGLVQLILQLIEAFHGIGMSAFPIAHFATKFADLAAQLPQFPHQALQGRAVCTGNKRLRRRGRKVQKRGIHKATL